MRSGGTTLAMLSIGDRYAVRQNAARDAIDRRPVCVSGRCSWESTAIHACSITHYFFIAGVTEVNFTRTLPQVGSAVMRTGILRWSFVR